MSTWTLRVIITYTILGVPYGKYSILGPQKILIIKATIVALVSGFGSQALLGTAHLTFPPMAFQLEAVSWIETAESVGSRVYRLFLGLGFRV